MADHKRVIMSRMPILVILGATGSGKSRLAIELAQKFCGEVISADSMQVYKGLDVITAKVTKEERCMATHHMLDIVDPLSIFTVVDFRNRALRIMDDLLAQNKLPIIVGGTNYYIESLLWQVLVEDPKIDSESLVYDRDNGAITIDTSARDVTNANSAFSGTLGESTREKVLPVVVQGNCDAAGNSSAFSGALGEGTREEVLPEVELVVQGNCDVAGNLSGSANIAVVCESGVSAEECANLSREKVVKEKVGLKECVPSDEEDVPRKKFRFEDSITNEELHRKLKELDPEMAARLHPNNRRKVMRSLQVFEQYGTKHSDILREQRLAGGSGLGGPLRHKNAFILWLQCDQKILDQRLDKRVDSMVDSGLVQELTDFHTRYNQDRLQKNTSPDYTKGIFQSIGFKEFHNYLTLSDDERNTEEGQALLKQGVEDLKLVTRRYARRQHRWVANRFIRRSDRQVPPVYTLDCTDVSLWESRVLEPAIAIVSAKIAGQEPNQEPVNKHVQNTKTWDNSNEQSHYCEVCERILVGEFQWKAHLEGAKHYRVARRKERLQKEKQISV